MNRIRLVLPTTAVAIAAVGLRIAHADDNERPYGIEKRMPWTTSKIEGTPQPPLSYITERVLPELSFESPVDLISVPGTDRMLIVELGGRLRDAAAQRVGGGRWL